MKVECIMTTDERLQIYVNYQYLIDNVLQMYSSDKYDYEELYYAGINGLMNSIDQYRKQIQQSVNEFKTYAMFSIKSEINRTIDNMTG